MQPVPKAAHRSDFREKNELLSAARFEPGISGAPGKRATTIDHCDLRPLGASCVQCQIPVHTINLKDIILYTYFYGSAYISEFGKPSIHVGLAAAAGWISQSNAKY